MERSTEDTSQPNFKDRNNCVLSSSWYDASATNINVSGGSGNADASTVGKRSNNNFNYISTTPTSSIIAPITAALTTSKPRSKYHSAVLFTSTTKTSTSAQISSHTANNPKFSRFVRSTPFGKEKSNIFPETNLEPKKGTHSTEMGTPTAAFTTFSIANNSSRGSCNTSNNSCNNSLNRNSNNTLASLTHMTRNSVTPLLLTRHSNGKNSGILNAAEALVEAVEIARNQHLNNTIGSDNNTTLPTLSGPVATNSVTNSPVILSIQTPKQQHTSRTYYMHGRSAASSSRSHSRSPSSYSSSQSTSSLNTSTRSHASSPIGFSESIPSKSPSVLVNSTRNLQSEVTTLSQGTSGMAGSGNASNSSRSSSNSSGNSSTTCTHTVNPVVHSEDNRPLAICVRNLPARSSDTSLKDGLFHEYKKHGKVTWVKVVGQNLNRYALVCFKKPDDVEKALEISKNKLFFGYKIEVKPYQGYDVEDNEFRPYEAELDEYNPKSTRTLFIGNLEKEITSNELRNQFDCFGEIIEIDIKKQGTLAYAFCQYSDIISVVKAIRKMDGEHLGNNRIKLGFGKSMPTNCVWIDGVTEKISDNLIQSHFSRYGNVTKVIVDRIRQMALVLYDQIQYAQTAVKEMRGATLRGRRLQVDFASRECQDAFYDKLEKQNAGVNRFNRFNETQTRSRASSFTRHQQNSNDGCSPSNTPGSSSSGSGSGSSIITATIAPPSISSAIIAGVSVGNISTLSGSSQLAPQNPPMSGSSTPARSRGSRSSRHTVDYDYLDTRRFRSYDEFSQGSCASHDEDTSATLNIYSAGSGNGGLRSDSPLLSRLGPIVSGGSGANVTPSSNERVNEKLEVTVNSTSGRRRCDKSPAKQKGDIRILQKERSHLLEQLEECPSSGDESLVTPRKRIKIDHHHSMSTGSGLSQSHTPEAGNSQSDQQRSNLNFNCDATIYDVHKSETRRLSDSNSHTNLNKYHQFQYHAHSLQSHQQQQQPVRRPSIDITATLGVSSCGSGASAGGAGSVLTRHGSVSSTGSGSDHHHHAIVSGGISNSMACKRRRVTSASNSGCGNGSSSMLSSSTANAPGISYATSSGSGNGISIGGNDDYQQHSSRGRGHPLHSHHSHEASGGESADGSRPGTPLCDERPEVLPSDPRRVPRDRRHDAMVLPLPKFGIQFFHQYRNSVVTGQGISNIKGHSNVNVAGYHHNSNTTLTSSSSMTTMGSSSGLGMHMLSNTNLSSSSHSSHSSAATTSTAAPISSGSSTVPGYPLHSPSTRYSSHWRPHQHQHHHHQQHQQHSHGHSSHSNHQHYNQTITGTGSAKMISPLRPRSLSSNSSDSDVPGQSSGSPSLEERIRTLDEMYERWSGGGSIAGGSNGPTNSSILKRHDFSSYSQTLLRHTYRGSEHHIGTPNTNSGNARPSTTSRYKPPEIDVHGVKPSEIVKSVLAKKSIFDDDLQRLKKNQWYEPSTDSIQLTKNMIGVCTSPGLPNLAATKATVVGCSTSNVANTAAATKPLLQRLSSLSPMNSPQASISPYNSPSPSPSVGGSSLAAPLLPNTAKMVTTAAMGTNSASLTVTSSSSISSVVSTSNSASAAMKGLQYPFPSHPPLPSTAAPLPIAQPAPPTGPAPADPPQPKLTSTTSNSIISEKGTSSSNSGSRVKSNSITKSLSVPCASSSGSSNGIESDVGTSDGRILTKSFSVPGSTNIGTVKSLNLHMSAPDASFHALSRSSSSAVCEKNEEETTKHSKQQSYTAPSTTKKGERSSHKHHHRNENEKRSSRSERASERRKNSTNSQHSIALTPRVEDDFSETEEKEIEKSEKERKERELEKDREKEKQHKEREREKEKERQEKEKREKEARKQKEEREAQDHKEREEREIKEREDRQRREQEDRDREREKEREKKERERKKVEREQRERREREDRELKEREEREKKEREEREQKECGEKERKEREELERKQHEEREQKEHEERVEKERRENEHRERKEREDREMKERECVEQLQHEHHDKNYGELDKLNRERQNRDPKREHSRGRKQEVTNKIDTDHIHPPNNNQSITFFCQVSDTDRQNNKENAVDERKGSAITAEESHKHRGRKSSRNSPIRLPKRRLSSQDSNNGNLIGHTLTQEDPAKRLRVEANKTTDRQGSKETEPAIDQTIKQSSGKHHQRSSNPQTASGISNSPSSEGVLVPGSEEKTKSKEHSNKHKSNKHHRQQIMQQHQPKVNTKDINKDCEDNNNMSTITENTITEPEAMVATTTATVHTISHHENISNKDYENTPTNQQTKQTLNSSGDEDAMMQGLISHQRSTNSSSQHKQRDHNASGGSHHSRHKNKRDHRERKRHSTTESIASVTSNALTDEEHVNNSASRRTSGAGSHSELTLAMLKPKQEVRNSSERKSSRCSDESFAIAQQPTTQQQQQRQSSQNTKATPTTRRVIISSGDSSDTDDPTHGGKKHSIFDIPDEGPYVSMYDKVKARSCKNMQKHEEEKKIKAKFTQLKQSRAKREEKKHSTSYEGDSESDFEERNQRSGGSSSYKSRNQTNLTSSDDDDNGAANMGSRRRNSQASLHPQRMFSDSDSTTTAEAEARRTKLHNKLLRLCDDDDDDDEDNDGEDSTDDEIDTNTNSNKLIAPDLNKSQSARRNSKPKQTASDSESHSQIKQNIKIKQELTDDEDRDNKFKLKIKSELQNIEDGQKVTDENDIKLKQNSIIKMEPTDSITPAIEIKQEYKRFPSNSLNNISDYEFALQHTSPKTSLKTQQRCSPESRKKHKKSKKRQKNALTLQCNIPQQHAHNIVEAKNVLVTFTPSSFQLLEMLNNPDSKVKSAAGGGVAALSSPYDPFDELKRDCSSITTPHTNNGANETTIGEKKRHKERKEKKREKMRNMSDGGCSIDSEKMSKEERHRLKKSKKSKSLETMRLLATAVNADKTTAAAALMTSEVDSSPTTPTIPLSATITPNYTSQNTNYQLTTAKHSGEKMEDIFGPISDEESQFSDGESKDMSPTFSLDTSYGGTLTSSTNITGPIVSAALNPYKQDPLTPKSHTVEENEENKQRLVIAIGSDGSGGHIVERERHRKEKRERRRKEREKHALSALQQQQQIDDDNSVDLDEAGRALEAQLMEDSDDKTTEDATPSTATTYRSDMTDVFRFSDGDENSSDKTKDTYINNSTSNQPSHALTSVHIKSKEKKKKKKRSKEERYHHQRRESSGSVQQQQQQQSQATLSLPPPSTPKLSIDILATKAKQDEKLERQMFNDDNEESCTQTKSQSPICKPSPSLPCLTDDDIDLSTQSILTTTAKSTKTNTDMLALSPMREKKLISPIPKTPTTNTTIFVNDKTTSNAYDSTHTSPMSSFTTTAVNVAATDASIPIVITTNCLTIPTLSSTSMDVSCTSSSVTSTATPTSSKKKPEIFIPGFDGKLDEQISESAVKSISVEFNSSILDSNVDEPKIPVESPPDLTVKQIDKAEDTKSRVTISQEETESAVSALLGESFGNSSNIDYSFQDDTLENDLNGVDSVNVDATEPDEEAAIAAKAIEASNEPLQPEEDAEEVNKAVQSLSTEEMDVKVDTPQSERGLQIDTDTEENVDEADNSGVGLSNELTDKEKKGRNKACSVMTTSNANSYEGNNIVQHPADSNNPAKGGFSLHSTKLEPPMISNLVQPAVQPVKPVLPSMITLDASLTVYSDMNQDKPKVVANNASSSIITTSKPSVTVQTSTPVKTTSLNPTPAASQQEAKGFVVSALPKSLITPPTISIPETSTHFAMPQLIISPRNGGGGVGASGPTITSISTEQHHLLSPKTQQKQQSSQLQGPSMTNFGLNVRTSSPLSPRKHAPTSRSSTPTRQLSSNVVAMVSPLPTPNMQQQQQQLLLHIGVQRTSPMPTQQQQEESVVYSSNAKSQSSTNVPTSAAITVQQSTVAVSIGGERGLLNSPHQSQNIDNSSVSGGLKNSSATMTNASSTNAILSPNQATKSIMEQNPGGPMGLIPLAVQKMPPMSANPTIISKVVSVQPQQAEQSTMSPPLSTAQTGIAKESHMSSHQQGGVAPHQQQHHQSAVLQSQQRNSAQIIHSVHKVPQLQLQQQQQQQQQPQYIQQQHLLQQQRKQIQQQQHQQRQQHHQQMQQQILHQQQQQQQQLIHMQKMQHHQQQQQQNKQNAIMCGNASAGTTTTPSSQTQPQQQQRQRILPTLQNSQQIQTLSQHPTQQLQSPQQQQMSLNRSIASSTTNTSSTQQNIKTLPGVSPSLSNMPLNTINPTAPLPSQTGVQLNQTQQQSQPINVAGMPFNPQSTTTSTKDHQQQQIKQSTPKSMQKTISPSSEATKQNPIIVNGPVGQEKLIGSDELNVPASKSIQTLDLKIQAQQTSGALAQEKSIHKQVENVSVICSSTESTAIKADEQLKGVLSMPTVSNTENSTIKAGIVKPLDSVIKKNDDVDSKNGCNSSVTTQQQNVETKMEKSSSPISTSNQKTTKSTEESNKASQSTSKILTNTTNVHKDVTKPTVPTVAQSNSKTIEDTTSIKFLPHKTLDMTNAGASSTDHETEEENETKQATGNFTLGRSANVSARGGGTAKRGRQPRGGKKQGVGIVTTAVASQSIVLPQEQSSGVQTRLRKPTTATPVARGRKGRPPRNVLTQQQQTSQQQEQILSTEASGDSSVKEKKSQNLSFSAKSETGVIEESSDVYEFHDDSGEESKATHKTTAAQNAAVSNSGDVRPRLILTIKPGQSTPIVKASEKPNTAVKAAVEVEEHNSALIPASTMQQQKTSTKISSNANCPLQPSENNKKREDIAMPSSASSQQVSQLPDMPNMDVIQTTSVSVAKTMTAMSQISDPTTHASNSLLINSSESLFNVVTSPVGAANTRKSRRLLEKDRCTIDDIIEDVVRNNAPPTAPAIAAAVASSLPKGAQTPPRRSGRNSNLNSKKASGSETPTYTPSSPATGRSRRSKDRKGSIEQANISLDLSSSDTEEQHKKPNVTGKDVQENTVSKTTFKSHDEQEPKVLTGSSITNISLDSSSAVPSTLLQLNSLAASTTVSSTATCVGSTTAMFSTSQQLRHLTSTSSTSTLCPIENTTPPQHPKKKALAAAEIESLATGNKSPTNNKKEDDSNNPPAILSMSSGTIKSTVHSTAAISTHKKGGGNADVVNKSLIDPVTGLINTNNPLQDKEAPTSGLPTAVATAATLAAMHKTPVDTKKIVQVAIAAATAENPAQTLEVRSAVPLIAKVAPNTITSQVSTIVGSTTTLSTQANIHQSVNTKPLLSVENATAKTLTTPISLLNKSAVSVVVKTSTTPVIIKQQIVQPQTTITPSPNVNNKQSIVVQQSPVVMHAQPSNVRPPTLKAHVLNSQKTLQQQQHQTTQPHHVVTQQQKQQTQPQQSSKHIVVSNASHVISSSNVVTARHALQQQQTGSHQQLLVNIPPPNVQQQQIVTNINSPHLQQQKHPTHQSAAQQTLVIKQGQSLTGQQAETHQSVHVVSSKATSVGAQISDMPPTTQQHHPSTPLQGSKNAQKQQQQQTSVYAASLPQQLQQQQKTQITVLTPQQQHQLIKQHQQQQQQQTMLQQPVSISMGTQQQQQPSTHSPMPQGVTSLHHQNHNKLQQQPQPQSQQQQTSTLVMQPSALMNIQHPTLLLQGKKSAHLQPQQQVHQHQLTASPPLPAGAIPLSSGVKTTIAAMHSLQAQGVQIFPGSVASPPPATPIAQQQHPHSSASVPGNMRTSIPTLSPQGQSRVTPLLLPTGMPIPPYENNMNETNFPVGGMRGVPARDSFIIYQHILRNQQETMNASLRGEFDDKMHGGSPPLELRRPGSVPRTITVPLGLQSPQDRSTDSPQVAQVYVHNTRVSHPHYTERTFFEPGRQLPIEPPPAHRSAASHSVVAPPPPPQVALPSPGAGASGPFIGTPTGQLPTTAATASVGNVNVNVPLSTTAAVVHLHHPTTQLLEHEREQQQKQQKQLQLQREKERIAMTDSTPATAQTSSTQQLTARNMQVVSPSQSNPQVLQPPAADSLLTLLQRYPVMWQGLLALKTDQAAVQMHFVFGNPHVARASLPCNRDGSTPPLRIAQRMRLEQTQLEGVNKKMQFENEHCMLLALPCGRDHADVLQQSRNLQTGFITYLQQKMAAGIVNIPIPGSEQAAYVVHIFPSCDFANENLERAAPDLKNRVAEIAHLLIVIATV